MGFIIVLHVIACLLLVVSILMQAGKGGGLSETFASAESMFGTQTNSFMVRLSTILAIIFFSTSLALAIHSAKGNGSLMAHAKLPAASPVAPKPEEPTVKVSEPKPLSDVKKLAEEAKVDALDKAVLPAAVQETKQTTTAVATNTTK